MRFVLTKLKDNQTSNSYLEKPMDCSFNFTIKTIRMAKNMKNSLIAKDSSFDKRNSLVMILVLNSFNNFVSKMDM